MPRGWRDETTTVAEMKQAVRRFVEERNWQGHHSPKNLAMSISIEAAELMEIFQWVDSREAKSYCLESEERFRHLQQEVADVVIYCLSLAGTLGFDLAAAIDAKIDHNAARYPAPVAGEAKEN
jgi:hypothetical protein